MQINCPWCVIRNRSDLVLKLDLLKASQRPHYVRCGYFKRSSDRVRVQRYRCNVCFSYFSRASFSAHYGQKKRHKNEPLRRLLVSGVSIRRAALLLDIHRTTVCRKLLFLSHSAKIRHYKFLHNSQVCFKFIQFDEMETFEHTKCKPLSIPLIVDADKRKILGFQVGSIPAKGLLAQAAKEKYGIRKDERPQLFERLFGDVKDVLHKEAHFLSDQNPTYPKKVLCHFPGKNHKVVKGRRGCIVGQGELKKIGYDPLFSLNHTCAMIRANVNRLFRRTWCTTKKIENLCAHLWIYLDHHNRFLTPS